jgi:hypothetical protein
MVNTAIAPTALKQWEAALATLLFFMASTFLAARLVYEFACI